MAFNFSEICKRKLKERGFIESQYASEIAKAVPCSKKHAYDLLKGRKRWHGDAISNVCEFLDISLSPDEKEQDELGAEDVPTLKKLVKIATKKGV